MVYELSCGMVGFGSAYSGIFTLLYILLLIGLIILVYGVAVKLLTEKKRGK